MVSLSPPLTACVSLQAKLAAVLQTSPDLQPNHGIHPGLARASVEELEAQAVLPLCSSPLSLLWANGWGQRVVLHSPGIWTLLRSPYARDQMGLTGFLVLAVLVRYGATSCIDDTSHPGTICYHSLSGAWQPLASHFMGPMHRSLWSILFYIWSELRLPVPMLEA